MIKMQRKLREAVNTFFVAEVKKLLYNAKQAVIEWYYCRFRG